MLINDDDWIINQYAFDKYLRSVYLSPQKCQRLIEILVDLQISLKYHFCESSPRVSPKNKFLVVSHIGKEIRPPKQHKNYEDATEINTEPLMEFMNHVMRIDVCRMSFAMNRVKKETEFSCSDEVIDITIDKENNVFLFKECYYL